MSELPPEIREAIGQSVPVKPSPLKASLVKGMAIVLPALITIAIFFWAWGVVRDYAVETIIRGIDAAAIFAPPESTLLPEEVTHDKLLKKSAVDESSPDEQYWKTPDGAVYRFPGDETSKLEDGETPDDESRVVYLRKGESYSGLMVLSALMNQRRSYDYEAGRVTSYSVIEYVIAIVLTIVLVIFLGIFARNYFGKQIVGVVDRVMQGLPVVSLVYPYAKQVVDFFFTDHKPIEFDAVVAVEWPREGCWQLGFVTGSGMKALTKGTNGRTHTTVFLPMSPIPMTGFTVFVPSEQVLQVDISVEEACMIILSGGVLTPPEQQPSAKTRVEADDFERRMSVAREERQRVSARAEARAAAGTSIRKTQRLKRDDLVEADEASDEK